MHTPLCRHAKGEPTELAAHAVRAGLKEIGFSEHAPMVRDDWDDWHLRWSELDAYVEKVQQARRDHPELTIKLGLEVDYLPGHEDWIRQLAGRQPWDYFIGSVHYITDAWALDNPHLVSEWKSRDTFQVWTTYFERLTMAAESGLFEIIGHVDLCKRFCFYPQQDATPLIARFLDAARRSGVAMELNTAGLRKDCKEIYPSAPILQMAHDYGVPITFGSDAHAPGDVGMNFAEAIALARSVGYTQSCRFTHKQRELAKF